MTQPTILDHVLVALLACLLVFATVRQQPKLKQITFNTPTRIAFYWTNAAALWIGAIVVGAVWLLAGRTLPDLGLSLHHERPVLGAAIALAMIVWIVGASWRDAGTPTRRVEMRERWRRNLPFMPETRREMAHMTALAVTAGATEEIIFRGYAISYVRWYTGESTAGLVAAVAIPTAVFTLAHLYHDRRSIARVFMFAVFMGAFFVVTGSILVPIVLHALIDLFAGMLGIWVRVQVEGERSTSA